VSAICHTRVSPVKTAEPIEVIFRLRTRVGPGNCVVDWVQIPMGGIIFTGKGRPTVKYRDTLRSSVQKRLICSLDCGLGWAQ